MALTAAPAVQALLLEVQEFDTRLAQLRRRADRLPETAQLAELAAQRETLRRRVASQTGEWEDAKAELRRVEADVAVVDARIQRDRARLEGSSSVKDIQGLEQELGALTRRKGDLEDIEIGVMEAVEEHEAALTATRAELAALETRATELTAARDAALGGLVEDTRHAEADRATVAGKVPAELLALYERQRERYGTGASHLRGGVTSASGVALNSHDMNMIRSSAPDAVIICPDSQAVLVRTEESGL